MPRRFKPGLDRVAEGIGGHLRMGEFDYLSQPGVAIRQQRGEVTGQRGLHHG